MPRETPVLEYDAPTPEPPTPAWVWWVFGLYLILLLAVFSAPLYLFLYDKDSSGLLVATVILVVGLVASALLMLAIPIRAKLRRPIRRRSVWLPIFGGSVLIAFLAILIFAAADDAWPTAGFAIPTMVWPAVATVWAGWMVLLGVISRRSNPVAMSARIYKSVIIGSLLELLTAIPLHLIARRRTECCAGMVSGIAIALGVMVAIIAFGPGVFFLFYRRWKETYGPKK